MVYKTRFLRLDGREGKIVKGDTEEEKSKFWKHAVFLKEHKFGWMILNHIKYFDLVLEYCSLRTF